MRRRDWPFPFIASGAQYGVVAALAAAELYVVVWAIWLFIGSLWQGHFAPYLPLLVFFFGQIYGVLPALLIGGLTGALVGALFAGLSWELSVRQGTLLGAGATAVLSLLWVGLLWVGSAIYGPHDLPTLLNLSRHDRMLLLYFDLPILLLYLGAGAWGGSKVARARLEQIQFLTKLSQKSRKMV